jgi:RimJ/RimL family protein N-acetyltransferase
MQQPVSLGRGRASATIRRVALLRTGRLLLRHWNESDLDAFFDLYSQEDLMRWLGEHPRRPLATHEEARDLLRRWHAREQGWSAPLGLWAIVPLIADGWPGQPAGTLLLVPDGPTGEVEVGWHLHPRHQGQGLVTEAANAVLALAWKAGIDQVMALTDLDNVASQRVARRLGMQDEGATDRWYGSMTRQFRKVIGSSASEP